MEDRRKILFFLSPGVGGAQRVSVLLSKMLDASRYEVVYAVVGKANASIMDFLPKDAVVRQIPIKNIYDFATAKIMALMRREKPYAVFCSQMYLNIRVIVAAKMIGGIRAVVRSNAMVDNLKKMRMNFFLARRTYRKADRIIAQSNAMREEIVSAFNIPQEKINVIYNPVDKSLIAEKLSMPLPSKASDETRFVCVGRVAPIKDYETVLRSFLKIRSQFQNAHLYIIGEYSKEAEYFTRLKNLLGAEKGAEDVHFMGYTNNPFVWIKSADVFILSSLKEGLPNALIEAVYIGIPVVSTDCAEVVRIAVKEGVNGFIYKQGAIDELAEKMVKAVSISTSDISPYVGATESEINMLFSF